MIRTNIEIENSLMEEAKELIGLKTKKTVVEEALRLLIAKYRQRQVWDLYGQLHWEGN